MRSRSRRGRPPGAPALAQHEDRKQVERAFEGVEVQLPARARHGIREVPAYDAASGIAIAGPFFFGGWRSALDAPPARPPLWRTSRRPRHKEIAETQAFRRSPAMWWAGIDAEQLLEEAAEAVQAT